MLDLGEHHRPDDDGGAQQRVNALSGFLDALPSRDLCSSLSGSKRSGADQPVRRPEPRGSASISGSALASALAMANLDNEKRTGAWWQALPSNG